SLSRDARSPPAAPLSARARRTPPPARPDLPVPRDLHPRRRARPRPQVERSLLLQDHAPDRQRDLAAPPRRRDRVRRLVRRAHLTRRLDDAKTPRGRLYSVKARATISACSRRWLLADPVAGLEDAARLITEKGMRAKSVSPKERRMWCDALMFSGSSWTQRTGVPSRNGPSAARSSSAGVG